MNFYSKCFLCRSQSIFRITKIQSGIWFHSACCTEILTVWGYELVFGIDVNQLAILELKISETVYLLPSPIPTTKPNYCNNRKPNWISYNHETFHRHKMATHTSRLTGHRYPLIFHLLNLTLNHVIFASGTPVTWQRNVKPWYSFTLTDLSSALYRRGGLWTVIWKTNFISPNELLAKHVYVEKLVMFDIICAGKNKNEKSCIAVWEL